MVKRGWIIVLGALAGCTSTVPAPEMIGNNYYVTGGSDCARRLPINGSSKILCVTEEGRPTGYRDPMTPAQMHMYAAQQQAEAYRSAVVANSIPEPQYPTYNPMQMPQLTPLGRPGQIQARCISTGIYTSCN